MVKPLEAVDELDRWIYGAENIGIVVDLDPRETYHALERGYLDADKFGRKWRSTKRRLLKPAAPRLPPCRPSCRRAPNITPPPQTPSRKAFRRGPAARCAHKIHAECWLSGRPRHSAHL